MAQKYRDFIVSLAAGVPKSVAVAGDYWQVLEATGKIKLSFDDGAAIQRAQGQGGPADYQRVTITSPIDQTVTLAFGIVGAKPPYDARATFAGTVNVATDLPSVQQPLTDITIAAGASSMLAAADATRTALVVRMPDDATGDIRIGDSTVAANKGLRLGAGDATVIDGGAAVYAYNTGADPVTVSLLSELAP